MNKILKRVLATSAALTALVVASAQPAAATMIVGGCTGLVEVCLTERDSTNVYEELYTVEPGATIAEVDVVAYLDTYTLGGRQAIVCVTPQVEGAEYDACGSMGLTRTNRQELVRTTVALQSVRIVPLTRVYVCEADLKVSLLVSVERTILTVCATTVPTFGT